MNLATNAWEAIGEDEGEIVMRTYSADVDRAYLANTFTDDQLEGGAYAVLAVSDTGCGMDRVTRERIFDPFFSTKFTGRGLGMAATLGIIRGHKGAITVYSEPGHGTVVKVLLPLAKEERARKPAPAEPAAAADVGGTILVVDDEEAVRDIGLQTLNDAGYSVLAAADGQEAVDLFQEHGAIIRAVLLDLTMPRKNGEEVFREIRAISPTTPVILSSGFAEPQATERFERDDLAAFLEKPYRPSDLVAMLRDILVH
jgi:CheY-like chemotaxis protein